MPTYLQSILAREAVDVGAHSPVRSVANTLAPALQAWGGSQLASVRASGSFAKGTANRSGTDIDLFLSLKADTTQSLQIIYDTLFDKMSSIGFQPKKQNVSINVRVGGYSVDLVPGKLQNALSTDHSLWKNRGSTWTKTNIDTHIRTVQQSFRWAEIRVLKIWRDQRSLDFPSFYLELTAIEALRGTVHPTLEDRVWAVLGYLRDHFENARVVDPANGANVISDDLTAAEKRRISEAATAARAASHWNQIIV